MANVPETPQVPQISQTQAAATPAGDSGLDSIFSQISDAIKAPLPQQYIQNKTIAEPRTPTYTPFQPLQQHNGPITGQVADVKRARRENAVAGLSNMIGRAGEQIAEKKQISLKDDLKTVMTSKTNIANAESVLQQDPNNAIAKGVIEANKKQLNTILSDPKKQKQLAKALDISYVDSSKNKTPEIQAYQAALKEHEAAGVFNSNNPQEHAVAQASAGAGRAGAQAPTQQPQQQQAPQSATPYADKAIAKDTSSMAENPQYAAALKQQQEAAKRMDQYIIPAAVRAESAKTVQAMKDGSAEARQQFGAVITFQKQANDAITKMQISDKRNETLLETQAMRDSSAFARTTLEVNARLKIADDKRLDPMQRGKLQSQSLEMIDKDINTISTTRKTLGAERDRVAQNLNLTKEDKAQQLQQLDMMINYNQVHLESMNQYRLQTASKIYGNVGETQNGRAASTAKPELVGTAKPKLVNSAKPKLVGSDNSDESGEDDDSDKYGIGDD